jgi:hypothetical protein
MNGDGADDDEDLKNIEFEYVNVDENILAPGRVRV